MMNETDAPDCTYFAASIIVIYIYTVVSIILVLRFAVRSRLLNTEKFR